MALAKKRYKVAKTDIGSKSKVGSPFGLSGVKWSSLGARETPGKFVEQTLS